MSRPTAPYLRVFKAGALERGAADLLFSGYLLETCRLLDTGDRMESLAYVTYRICF